MSQTKQDVFNALYDYQSAEAEKYLDPLNVPALIECNRKIEAKLKHLGIPIQEYVDSTFEQPA